MEKDRTLGKNWRGDPESVEPHFDDERTILSAQPVVPLETVAKTRSRRALILAGAFVIAALLGSAAALALVRLRQPTVLDASTKAETVEEEIEEPVAQVPETETKATESPSDAQLEEIVVPRPSKPVRQGPAQHRSATTTQVRTTIKTSPQDSDDQQPRMVDQWQERRQRRANRERSPEQNHHRSDLFRIREIFEGPRRSRLSDN